MTKISNLKILFTIKYIVKYVLIHSKGEYDFVNFSICIKEHCNLTNKEIMKAKKCNPFYNRFHEHFKPISLKYLQKMLGCCTQKIFVCKQGYYFISYK